MPQQPDDSPMKIKHLIIPAYLTLTCGSPFAHAAHEELIHAIWTVESSNAPDGPTMGDGGLSRGPLQCSRAAWIDSRVPGDWSDVDRLDYAKRVFEAYTDRWAGKNATDEQRARCWNAGPAWRKRMKATDGYWSKVQKELRDDTE